VSDGGQPDDRDLGGDPACWLDRVCPECGGFVDDAETHDCAERLGGS
jgi:hypothetical protein